MVTIGELAIGRLLVTLIVIIITQGQNFSRGLFGDMIHFHTKYKIFVLIFVYL